MKKPSYLTVRHRYPIRRRRLLVLDSLMHKFYRTYELDMVNRTIPNPRHQAQQTVSVTIPYVEEEKRRSHRTGLELLCPSRCVSSSSGKILPPATKAQRCVEMMRMVTREGGERIGHAVNGIHNLNRSIRILVLQPVKNELHVRCTVKARTSNLYEVLMMMR